MAKRDMKKALGASLRAEEQAVKGKYAKFDKAETALAKKESSVSNEHPVNGDGKVIRDSFTMPMTDYELIEPLKKRCMKAGISANKSELLRAGLRALTEMSDRDLLQLLERQVRVKPGRRAG